MVRDGGLESVGLHCLFAAPGVRVGDRDEARTQRRVGVVLEQPRPGPGVHLAHPPEADHRDADLAGPAHVRGTSPSFATAGSSPSPPLSVSLTSASIRRDTSESGS